MVSYKYFIVTFHYKYNWFVDTSSELVPPVRGLENFWFLIVYCSEGRVM